MTNKLEKACEGLQQFLNKLQAKRQRYASIWGDNPEFEAASQENLNKELARLSEVHSSQRRNRVFRALYGATQSLDTK
jgi:hypothetical protein